MILEGEFDFVETFWFKFGRTKNKLDGRCEFFETLQRDLFSDEEAIAAFVLIL